MQTDWIDLYLVGEISGVGQFSEVVKDAVEIEVYGISYLVASLDCLIKSKREAVNRGRHFPH
jgi:hypothetical protein